jgi:predicted transcriptional regulator
MLTMLPNNLMNVPKCEDLVQCAFNLNEFEVSIYRKLVEVGPSRADEIAEAIGRDRSTVYRSLQKLMSCGIVFRETRSIERGGYFHVYIPISRQMMKEKLERCVDEWYQRMLSMLSKFSENF